MKLIMDLLLSFIKLNLLVLILKSYLNYAEYQNINIKIINPTNLSIIERNSILIEANLYGELPSNIDYNQVAFCIYDSSSYIFNSSKYNLMKNNGFPNNIYQCISILEPINNIINRTNSFKVSGYNPGSLRYNSILVNMNEIYNNNNNIYNNNKRDVIICEDTVYFDSIYLSDETNNNIQPISNTLVDLYRDNLLIRNSDINNYNMEIINDKSKSSFHIVIFFIDFQIHGCNMRLVNFGCQNLNDIISIIKKEDLIDIIDSKINIIIEFLVAAENGKLLNVLFSCNSNIKIRIIPALYINNIEFDIDNKYYINQELLLYLSTIDVIITGNTNGEIQTDVLFSHISKLSKPPCILLDLCNLPFFGEYIDKWSQIINGFISPSLFVANHISTKSFNLPVEVVYPSISSKFIEKSINILNNSFNWPRLINSKFRIGCIGNHIYERSPSLCLRFIAHLYTIKTINYINDNFEFIIIGGGFQFEDMKNLAITLGIDKYVLFTNTISDMEEVFSSLDVVINTKIRGELYYHTDLISQ
jgi:hypothetical protein